ncbi:methyltransferase [Conexibacter woesei]|uniref:methyltransferase n=1 Tax=Conexibacter woesei TaxID=191495 RepID=UPI000479971E|nr:methyltransferase [Conexibacter woesei]
MISFTKTEAVTPEPIVAVAAGFMAAKQLFAASEVGLFAGLADGPLDLAALAGRLGLPERSCRIVADAMVGQGLLTREGDRYANSAAAATYLAGDGDALDLRPFLAFWDGISYNHWTNYSDTVRRDAPQSLDVFTSAEPDPERTALFFGGVSTYNTAHALMLAQTYDFSGHARMLDLAGLSGAFITAAAAARPDLKATFFAEPSMVEFAGESFPAELDVEVVGADVLADPIPGRYDCVLLEHVVHRYSAEDNMKLLRRARAVAEDGATLLVLDFYLDEGAPERPLDALLAGEYLVIDGTVVWPEADVRSWLEPTGWRFVETRAVPGSPRVLIAEAA